MSFKVKLEVDPDGENEVLIRCRSVTDEVLRIQAAVNSGADDSEMEFHLNGNDYFIRLSDILFFETDDGKTAAHTKDRMYYTELKLYELEDTLPRNFMRVSKSCIINMKAISSLRKELTGSCEASFNNTQKRVFISRSYYKLFRESITEMRLKR